MDGSPANDLAHHSACFHNPDRAESLVRHAYATTGHEEVFDVSRIETPVGNGVAVGTIHAFPVHGVGNKRVIGKFFSELLLGIVQVDAPGAGHAPIWKVFFGDDILLGQDDVPEQAT